jgi:hypothetical protein
LLFFFVTGLELVLTLVFWFETMDKMNWKEFFCRCGRWRFFRAFALAKPKKERKSARDSGARFLV